MLRPITRFLNISICFPLQQHQPIQRNDGRPVKLKVNVIKREAMSKQPMVHAADGLD